MRAYKTKKVYLPLSPRHLRRRCIVFIGISVVFVSVFVDSFFPLKFWIFLTRRFYSLWWILIGLVVEAHTKLRCEAYMSEMVPAMLISAFWHNFKVCLLFSDGRNWFRRREWGMRISKKENRGGWVDGLTNQRAPSEDSGDEGRNIIMNGTLFWVHSTRRKWRCMNYWKERWNQMENGSTIHRVHFHSQGIFPLGMDLDGFTLKASQSHLHLHLHPHWKRTSALCLGRNIGRRGVFPNEHRFSYSECSTWKEWTYTWALGKILVAKVYSPMGNGFTFRVFFSESQISFAPLKPEI